MTNLITMKKFLAICLAAGGSVSAAAAGPGSPGALQVSIRPNAQLSTLIDFSYLSNSGTYVVSSRIAYNERVTKTVRYPLAPKAQIVYLNNEEYLVGAGETLILEMALENIVQSGKERWGGVGQVAGKTKAKAMKHMLPRMIDSAYNTVDVAVPMETFDRDMAAVRSFFNASVEAAGLSADERALIIAYESGRRLMHKQSYVRSHPEAGKMEGFSKWYYDEFNIANPQFDGIAHNIVLKQIVDAWWTGRKMEDPKLADEFEMVDLMRFAKAELMKQEAAKVWLYSETRYRQFSTAVKNVYPILNGTLKPYPQKKYIDSLYKSYAVMDRGLPMPQFSAKNAAGKTVKLSDFKGKMVVMDFWANWCTGCIANLPKFKAIEEKYKGKEDIVFLTIAWEEPGFDELWRELSAKHKIEGEHNLILTINRKSKEYQDFFKGISLTGVPRYIVLDKEGNYLDNSLSVMLGEKVEQQIFDFYNEQQ